MKSSPIIALVFFLIATTHLRAEIQLAPVFSDNMILQREVTIPLRGMADEEEQVIVSFNNKEYTGHVTVGRWQVTYLPWQVVAVFILQPLVHLTRLH